MSYTLADLPRLYAARRSRNSLAPHDGPSALDTRDYAEQVANRGFAPASWAGAGAILNNALGMLDPVTTGLASMGELAFGEPKGTFGGIQNIPGYQSYQAFPNNFRAREQFNRWAQSQRDRAGGNFGQGSSGKDKASGSTGVGTKQGGRTAGPGGMTL